MTIRGSRFAGTVCFAPLIIAIVLVIPAYAESGLLFLRVVDGSERPISGLQIGIKGIGGSDISDESGKVKLELGPQTKEGTAVGIQILPKGKGAHYTLLSPLDERVIVPSFLRDSENYVTVVAVKKGDRVLLANDLVVGVFADGIAHSVTSRKVTPASPPITFSSIAGRFGFAEADVKAAIADLEVRSRDPYKRGMAELADGRPSSAIPLLVESLNARISRESSDRAETFNAASGLGWAQFFAGHYLDSKRSFQIALNERPNDPKTLEGMGLALSGNRDNFQATEFLRSARNEAIIALGAEDVFVADIDVNLAKVLTIIGALDEVESLLSDAEAITNSKFGPDSIARANISVYRAQFFLAQSLKIRPDSNYFMPTVDFLAKFQKIESAQKIIVDALRIQAQYLPQSRSWLVVSRDILAQILMEEQDAQGAAQCYKSALKAHVAISPGDRSDTAILLNQLGGVETAMQDLQKASTTLTRSAQMMKATLGADSIGYAEVLANEALLSHFQGEMPEAQAKISKAIQLALSVEGPNSSTAKDFKGWQREIETNQVISLGGPPRALHGNPPGSIDLEKDCPEP